MAAPIPPDALRRLRAKRQNESIKLAAQFFNTAALAVFGAAFIVPTITANEGVRWPWIPVAAGLHLCAHAMLRLLQSEE